MNCKQLSHFSAIRDGHHCFLSLKFSIMEIMLTSTYKQIRKGKTKLLPPSSEEDHGNFVLHQLTQNAFKGEHYISLWFVLAAQAES